MQAQYTFTTFTPGEAERITGLSTTNQRDWRRRKFLPAADGHARFDMFGLAEMWFLKLSSDRGIGPHTAKEVSDWCAAGIAWHALKGLEAYEGDHLRTFEWEAPGSRPPVHVPQEIRDMIEQAAAEADVDLPAGGLNFEWGAKAEWLAKQIFRLKGFPRLMPARFFIWWADGTHRWDMSLDHAFEGGTFHERYQGAVIVLDLEALGGALAERAGRPLVHVEFPADFETGEIEQPIQYGTPVPLAQTRNDGDSE